MFGTNINKTQKLFFSICINSVACAGNWPAVNLAEHANNLPTLALTAPTIALAAHASNLPNFALFVRANEDLPAIALAAHPDKDSPAVALVSRTCNLPAIAHAMRTSDLIAITLAVHANEADNLLAIALSHVSMRT